MADYVLDSNHASPLVTLGHPLRRRILTALNADDTFALCVPVVTETFFGIALLPRAQQNIAEWRRLRPLLSCIIPDEVDGEMAAELQMALRRRGRQLETVDATIATIALRYNRVLLTSDKDFQAVPNLHQENWLIE
jgi:tRNA(fMet)-specific endonuclease VapC